MVGSKSASHDQDDRFEQAYRAYLTAVKQAWADVDIESVISAHASISPFSGCVGTAGSLGTFGTITGTAGTLGTFGTYGCAAFGGCTAIAGTAATSLGTAACVQTFGSARS
jgi:hypothetical protein